MKTTKIILYLIILAIIIIYYMNKPENFTDTKKYNLAFYTCFYGSNNNNAFKIPEVPSNKYDCFYYTNNKDILDKLVNTKWIGVYDNKNVTDDAIESCMYGKYVKVLPNEMSPINNYEYTCFLDSKLDKVSEEFVEDYIHTYFINNDYALLLREHVFLKGNIWNEYNESMKQERYRIESDKYKEYIQKQLDKGLKETTLHHCQCGFLIRNMKHDIINKLNNTWYENIKECGIQDQISFFFIKQYFDKYILSFTDIPFVK